MIDLIFFKLEALGRYFMNWDNLFFKNCKFKYF